MRELEMPDAISFHGAIATTFADKYERSAAFGERFRVWTALFNQYVDPTDRVLDLGCGSGIFSNFLAGKGCSVIGIDGSAEMIALCNQKKVLPNVRYIRQKLPLNNPGWYGQQDIIIASSLLEYIDDMERLLQQVKLMLKPTGLLIVSLPNKTSIYRRLERLTFRLVKRPRYFAYTRTVSTATTFNRHLTELGFDVLETTYFSSYDPFSRLLKSLLPKAYVNNLFVGIYRKK